MTADESEQWIVIRNWEKFQHYRDRWVPWIKFYTELLHDSRYLALPETTRLILLELWLYYAAARAQVPLNTALISRQLSIHRVTRRQLETLNHAGFIEFSSSPNLEHVYMSARPTRAREEKEKKRPPLGGGLSSTVTGSPPGPDSPEPPVGARSPDPTNTPPPKPTYDVIRTFITNAAGQYTDPSILDEIALQERRRNDPLTDKQKTELLQLAETLRTNNNAA